MNDLKTVRDALKFYSKYATECHEGTNTYCVQTGHIAADRGLKARKALETLDRIIETPAPQGCVDDQPKCTWDFYRSTLERFVYETTHLSAENADGSHDCKISKKCLLHGRIALELLGKLSAAPTPAPSEPSFCGIKIIEDNSLDEDEIQIYAQDKLKARAYLKLQSGETEKVDVEALKKQIRHECMATFEQNTWAKGWNACIDHLANTGRLR